MTSRLIGQVGIVTGGGRGIGRAIALALAADGLAVAVIARTSTQVHETVAAAEQYGVPALGFAIDVTDAAAAARVLPQIEQRLGPIDLLVNAAGRAESREAPLWAADLGEVWAVVETNLRGPMLYCAAVLPDMLRRRRGRIVNVNSLMGARAGAGYAGYAVSKAGLLRLTDCLHAGLEGSGVAVFDLSPGLVRTEMTAAMPRLRDVPAEQWTPAERSGEVVVELATGRYDALSGRLLHVVDDLEELLRRAGRGLATDARKLRLRPYHDDDPLADA